MATIKDKAFEIIGIFEDFLQNNNIKVETHERNEYKEENGEEPALIFGQDFDELEDELIRHLKGEKWFIYKLYDEEDDFGRVKTNCQIEEFKRILEEYKETHSEDYNTDDFLIYMREKGYKAKWIRLNGEVYF